MSLENNRSRHLDLKAAALLLGALMVFGTVAESGKNTQTTNEITPFENWNSLIQAADSGSSLDQAQLSEVTSGDHLLNYLFADALNSLPDLFAAKKITSATILQSGYGQPLGGQQADFIDTSITIKPMGNARGEPQYLIIDDYTGVTTVRSFPGSQEVLQKIIKGGVEIKLANNNCPNTLNFTSKISEDGGAYVNVGIDSTKQTKGQSSWINLNNSDPNNPNSNGNLNNLFDSKQIQQMVTACLG